MPSMAGVGMTVDVLAAAHAGEDPSAKVRSITNRRVGMVRFSELLDSRFGKSDVMELLPDALDTNVLKRVDIRYRMLACLLLAS